MKIRPAAAYRIFVKFNTRRFFEIVEKIQVPLKSEKKNGHFT